MVDRAALEAEIRDLAGKLKQEYTADEERSRVAGRPFAGLQWVLGVPDSGKYPAGPAFLPMGSKPSLFNSLMMMTAQDATTTALGGAFFYGMGYAHAKQLGVASGHKLGFWTAMPAIALGLLAGINKGTYRYSGFMENGNAPLYPGYLENSAPYFLKHKVSDRVVSVGAGLHMDGRRHKEGAQ